MQQTSLKSNELISANGLKKIQFLLSIKTKAEKEKGQRGKA